MQNVTTCTVFNHGNIFHKKVKICKLINNTKESHDLHQFGSSYSAFNLKREANFFYFAFCLITKAVSHMIFPFPEHYVLFQIVWQGLVGCVTFGSGEILVPY